MTKPREICTAHAALSDLLAACARLCCVVNKIQAKAPDGETVPPHWTATAADLPAFFHWLEKEGRITNPPELFTAETLRCWLVRMLQTKENGILGYNVPSSYFRDKLSESPLLTEAERSIIPRPHTFKKLLETLSDEPHETRIVQSLCGGKFCIEDRKIRGKRV